MLPPGRVQIAILAISLGLLVRPAPDSRLPAPGARLSAFGSQHAAVGLGWEMLPAPLQQRLERAGLDRATFPAWIAETRTRHATRIREGDDDHLVFYALQSTRTTKLPVIEPAVSARTLIASLDAATRARFLADPTSLPVSRAPCDVRARLDALVRALESTRPTSDPRAEYMRALLHGAVAASPGGQPWRDRALAFTTRAYFRAMRFLDEQERAGRTANAAGAVAALYRTRGLSTDTSLEAGFGVHLALSTLRALEPERRLRHVVIVGPGLDLAPRTGLIDAVPPQSVQPFALVDALIALGLADAASLRVTCLDINPRVVSYLERARTQPLTLTLASGLAAVETMTVSDDYRRYVERLGRAIGETTIASAADGTDGRSGRRVTVRREVLATLDARTLDIVTDRLDLSADAVIVTNVLPYLDDRELTLALANIRAMLAARGVLIHNEARPEVGEITAALGLPLTQARTAILATVRGGAPLYDSVFIHQRD
jgi:hypothetical protein